MSKCTDRAAFYRCAHVRSGSTSRGAHLSRPSDGLNPRVAAARATARRGTRPAVCGVPSACCACIRTSSRPRRWRAPSGPADTDSRHCGGCRAPRGSSRSSLAGRATTGRDARLSSATGCAGCRAWSPARPSDTGWKGWRRSRTGWGRAGTRYGSLQRE